jgi:hypothetical protein
MVIVAGDEPDFGRVGRGEGAVGIGVFDVAAMDDEADWNAGIVNADSDVSAIVADGAEFLRLRPGGYFVGIQTSAPEMQTPEVVVVTAVEVAVVAVGAVVMDDGVEFVFGRRFAGRRDVDNGVFVVAVEVVDDGLEGNGRALSNPAHVIENAVRGVVVRADIFVRGVANFHGEVDFDELVTLAEGDADFDPAADCTIGRGGVEGHVRRFRTLAANGPLAR